LKSHGGFLSYLQDRKANTANLAAIFCPTLVCPEKAIVGIKFLAYFCSPLGMKNAVKYWKDFLLYFTTLKTYCETIVRIYNFETLNLFCSEEQLNEGKSFLQ
jgi:hypothetical protein